MLFSWTLKPRLWGDELLHYYSNLRAPGLGSEWAKASMLVLLLLVWQALYLCIFLLCVSANRLRIYFNRIFNIQPRPSTSGDPASREHVLPKAVTVLVLRLRARISLSEVRSCKFRDGVRGAVANRAVQPEYQMQLKIAD